MHPMALRLQLAPRCQEHCRRSKVPCRNPAIRGRRACRLHGGKGGPPKRNTNSSKHGRNSAAAIAERKQLRELLRAARNAVCAKP